MSQKMACASKKKKSFYNLCSSEQSNLYQGTDESSTLTPWGLQVHLLLHFPPEGALAPRGNGLLACSCAAGIKLNEQFLRVLRKGQVIIKQKKSSLLQRVH